MYGQHRVRVSEARSLRFHILITYRLSRLSTVYITGEYVLGLYLVMVKVMTTCDNILVAAKL